MQGVVGDPIRAPLVNVCIKPCNEPDSVNIADGIQVLCGVATVTSTEYDAILTSEVIEDLSQLPVANAFHRCKKRSRKKIKNVKKRKKNVTKIKKRL